ncbi:uncharacterized protein F4822DRAFT_432152 [Hypoxylon trugodes]|uniref:uncharacterized protein n=1 Tax=Hypoxylon trugodes TaxID=326681 RepID=UPI00219FF245|nr:uncharacterized protein F4822DRAFT_432152 [Hypoxylon trugodes]KAI1385304.1 hypothetical protein F4822DRAFT_432152 [Hypoxylon trugodes]
MGQDQNNSTQNERSNISKPQIFVQLAFGVSWTQRRPPQTHTVTYMSRNLKNARDSGNFPRQVPPANTNFLSAPDSRHHHASRQQQQRQQSRQHHAQHSHTSAHTRDSGRSRGQSTDQPSEQLRARPRVGSRAEGRGMLHERGRSAPPPFNDSPWDVQNTSSSALLQHRSQASGDSSNTWKALPAPPSQFRLGEDGLPWSAWAWPGDIQGDDEEDDIHYMDEPTTVSVSAEGPRNEDPERVRELESLSTAMMTVDNGFENQWWYQGSRESVEQWWPQEEGEEGDDGRPLTMTEAMLLSGSEPPLALASSEEPLPNFHGIVSPMSRTSSPAQSFSRPLQRSLTTRSEELWLER